LVADNLNTAHFIPHSNRGLNAKNSGTIGNGVALRGNIRVGSILVEQMAIAGE